MYAVFNLFKFLHVAGAIIWIGGACALAILNARLTNAKDRPAAALLAQQAAVFGQTVLGPAAGVTLVAGIVSAYLVGIDFRSLWILWGFAGILGSMVLGAFFIRKANVELSSLAANPASDPSHLLSARRRLSNLNVINLMLLLSVVAAMVFKPVL